MIRLDDLVAANPGCRVEGTAPAAPFSRFCFDSRLVEPGDLFVAVRTPRRDGHEFLADAVARGAAAVMVAGDHGGPTTAPLTVAVDDTVAAMERYGAHVVRAWSPTVVAVTGTVGKTTAKEAVAEVLARRYRVFRTPGNFSGRFGLAVALGGLQPDHRVAVVEMATGHFGEMAAMCAMAPPTIGIVTRVAEAHLLALDDLAGVAREKGELVARLPPDGLAVLNADDPRVMAMAGRGPAPVVTFGRRPGADWWADGVAVDPGGTTCTAHHGPAAIAVRLQWPGSHFVAAALAALAVADHVGLPPDEAAAALARLAPVPGRLRPLRGPHGTVVLDDSYNAAPVSVLAGLDTLADLPATTRVAVLGDMAELGADSEALHRAVGRRVAEVADALVTRGNLAHLVADEARRSGLHPSRIAVTFTAEDAAAAAAGLLRPGGVALVKGSTPSRMEQVTALLVGASADRDALVRQDAAWRTTAATRPDRPTWLEVDLGAVRHNVARLAARAAPAEVMVVLKADAYGHGAVPVAHTALRNGATRCAVACVPEGRDLRRGGVDAPVLVLGYTPGWQAREALRLDLTLAVFDPDSAAAYAEAALALDTTARVHVKVDTGMHRLGVDADEAVDFVRRLQATEGLVLEGVFTHLAVADEPTPEGTAATDAQLARFDRVLADLGAAGLRPPLAHAANSAALLTRPGARYDLVRPGIAVYGLPPDPRLDLGDLRPVLTWKSQVAQVRRLPPGEAVGYGRQWVAEVPSTVATVPVGYADGFRRGPTTWRHVLVRGARAPVVGRVSMDQVALDVTGIEGVRRGDEVVLIGDQGDEHLPATLVAEWLGTSCYEVVAEILARVPRVS